MTFHRKEGEALHPARESLTRIEEQRLNMGSYTFAAQYQQWPAPAGGGDIRWEWFRTYDPANPPKFTRRVQSWDTATKDDNRADYSACVTFGETEDRQWCVIDVWRGRLLFPELKSKVRKHAELHGASTVLIEDCSSGSQLIQELIGEGFAKIQAEKPKSSKYERLISCTAKIEAGKVWLPNQSHWLKAFETELTLFPNSKHDDQVDAFSQGLLWMGASSGAAYWLWMMDEVERRRNEGPQDNEASASP